MTRKGRLEFRLALTIILFSVIFAGVTLELESVGPCNFFKSQSMPILPIPCKRRQEIVLMPKYSLE